MDGWMGGGGWRRTTNFRLWGCRRRPSDASPSVSHLDICVFPFHSISPAFGLLQAVGSVARPGVSSRFMEMYSFLVVTRFDWLTWGEISGLLGS